MTSTLTIEIDQVDRDEWVEIMRCFDDASIYQTWLWGSIRWGEKKLTHIVLKRDGEVIAAAQLYIIKIPLIDAGISYLKWGPMWQLHGRENDPAALREIIRAIIDEYAVRRGLCLKIVTNEIGVKSTIIRSTLQAQGFALRPLIIPYRTLVIDLASPLYELRKSLKQKWRQSLNYAEREELTVIMGTGDDFFQTFSGLYKEMRSRKKFAEMLNISDVRAVQKTLPEPQKMRIMICEFQKEPIAGIIVSRMGNLAVWLLGATGNKRLKLHGSFLLQWRMIEWLKENGCAWYDLGGINPDKNPGTYRFKAGLSGKLGKEMVLGEFEICQNLKSFVAGRAGEMVRGTYRQIKFMAAKSRKIMADMN